MAFQGTHEHPFASPRIGRSGWSPVAVVTIMLLGVAIAFLTALGIWAASAAQNARNDARAAAANTGSNAQSMPGMDMGASTSTAAGALTSYSGAAPANAAALAAAHVPYPAALPAAPAGPVATVNLVLKDITVQRLRPASSTRRGPGPAVHLGL